MHWTVAAPFNRPGDRWLAPFVPGDHTFEVVARPGKELNWHERSSAVTSPREWYDYVRQSDRALRGVRDGGIITVFPQLAAGVGALARLQFRQPPMVAWFFNTERYTGPKQALARWALHKVDRFVVHSEVERHAFTEWLGLPLERAVFVPLQYGGTVELDTAQGEREEPFVLAVGSGHRDFATLFAALERLQYRTVVISSPRALAGCRPPACVEIREGVPRAEIRRLVRRARVNAIPMTTEGIVGGTVTIVETMRHGRGPLVTRRSGVEDYVSDEVSGLLIQPYDVDGWERALQRAWEDTALRALIDSGADSFAEANCTDEAAGRALGRVLDELACERDRT